MRFRPFTSTRRQFLPSAAVVDTSDRWGISKVSPTADCLYFFLSSNFIGLYLCIVQYRVNLNQSNLRSYLFWQRTSGGSSVTSSVIAFVFDVILPGKLRQWLDVWETIF